MSAVVLTEKLLADAGGWQAMKQARALCQAGRVTGASYAPPLLAGMVREGSAEFRAGLKIISRTNVENVCTCRVSRGQGMICAHSLAVGLAVLRPAAPARGEPEPAAEALKCGPHLQTGEGAPSLLLHFVLPPNFETAWEKNAVMIGVEADIRGRRVLLDAVDAAMSFRVCPEDLAVFEKVRELNGGELCGLMMLTREKFLNFAKALRGHPRVTLGKSKAVDVSELLAGLPASEETKLAVATEAAEMGQPEFELALEGSLNHLAAKLRAVYGTRVVLAGITTGNFSYPDPKNAERRLARNVDLESAALDRLRRAGFAGPDASGELVLKREPAILRFFASELRRLQREWVVTIGARFTTVTESIERIAPRLDVQSSGENWFDLSVHLETPGGDTFSAAEIQRLLRTGQNHVRLKNNRVAVFDAQMLDELHHALVDCDPQQQQPGTYRLDRAHAGYLAAAVGDEARFTGVPAWQQWTRAQRQFDTPEPVPLGALEEVLRPYQKQGVYWMNFLARNGLGGILADEMGLGKTVQALAFLKTTAARALIVCPSSLVYNWLREAACFTPELVALAITGAQREAIFAEMGAAQLVITSYALLRRDIARYRGCEFGTVILDEAQHIKNPETQNAQAASELRARTRFVLTGTPMENSIRDLWSIMQFVMPGYLGKKEDFRERYEQPISRGASAVGDRLANRIRPFVLRRLKKNVATDLPDKLEQVVYCELNPVQREVYKKLLDESRRQIANSASSLENGQKKMLILTALLRLRQVCCDLRLLKIVESTPLSGKMEMLDELIREAIDGGHRVLVFSQFVALLALIRQQFEAAEIPFCYLDGATRDRAGEIDRFQAGTQIPVFLISLKAGGTGLNLTAADTVIHVDPWWNPAVEAQATDRAHRIGQRNIVTAYKLITRNTIEEKILALQNRKRELIDATVESEQPLMSGLGMNEIEELLR